MKGRAAVVFFDPTLPPAVRRGRRRLIEGGQNVVVQANWTDPDDVRPDAKRKPRQIEGWRTLCVLRHIEQVGGDIEPRHIRAGDWLRQRFDLATKGLSSPRELYEGGSHVAPGPRAGPSAGAIASAMADSEVQVALRPFSFEQCRLLSAIVLENMAIQKWAAAESERRDRRVSASIEQGKLIAILEILAKRQEGEIEEAVDRGRLPEL